MLPLKVLSSTSKAVHAVRHLCLPCVTGLTRSSHALALTGVSG